MVNELTDKENVVFLLYIHTIVVILMREGKKDKKHQLKGVSKYFTYFF
jgi:hypothetical protein